MNVSKVSRDHDASEMKHESSLPTVCHMCTIRSCHHSMYTYTHHYHRERERGGAVHTYQAMNVSDTTSTA